jgi:NAD(P)-dependent dehydrogenase (short-subunit alcohol dehydrogenase family)
MKLQGQTALVTGASRGIGRAIAEALAREGARLVIAGRSSQLRQAARALALHSEVHAVRADVSRPADVRRLFAAVRKRLGSLDILVNNAGIAEASPVAEMPDEVWQRAVDVNLTATFLCARAALQLMLPRQRGHILNVVSVAAFIPYTGNAAYCAAKAGVLQFTRVLRREVRGSGIRVTALLPGATNTAMWDTLWPDAPRERMMSPADVAEAALSAILLPDNAVVEELIVRPISGSV